MRSVVWDIAVTALADRAETAILSLDVRKKMDKGLAKARRA